MSKFLLSAPFLLLVAACSKPHVSVPMPLPPANLAQPCSQLPDLPDPLVDPDRLQWEADVTYAYAECAAKHRATVNAWKDAAQAAGK